MSTEGEGDSTLKILCLNGSPRGRDGNTQKMVNAFFQGAESAGAESSTIYAKDLSVGFCKGCFRSREERLYWLQFSVDQKREVIRLCQSRRARVMRARQEALARQQDQASSADQGELF